MKRTEIDRIPIQYLECRDIGHAWRHHTDGEPVKSGRTIYFSRTMWCPNCDSLRKEILAVDPRGNVEKVNVKYSYPEGYRLVKGQATRTHIWHEVLHRSGILRKESNGE